MVTGGMLMVCENIYIVSGLICDDTFHLNVVDLNKHLLHEINAFLFLSAMYLF